MSRKSKGILKFAALCSASAIPLFLYLTLIESFIFQKVYQALPNYNPDWSPLSLIWGWLAVALLWAFILFFIGLMTGGMFRLLCGEKPVKLKAWLSIVIFAIYGYVLLLEPSLAIAYIGRGVAGAIGEGSKPFWSDIYWHEVVIFLTAILGGAVSGGFIGYSFVRVFGGKAD